MRRQIVAVAVYDQLATEDISHPSIAVQRRPRRVAVAVNEPLAVAFHVRRRLLAGIGDHHTRVNVRGSRC